MENFNNKRNLRPVPSLLWKGINLTYISKNNLKTLERFRFGGINFKLALPDPDVHGLRYMQTLTYCLANFMSRDKRVWEIVKNTASRNLLGSPVTVRHNNEDVCLDYLQGALELDFMEKHIPFGKTRNIMEIGAGYGRTAHVILSNHDIEKYCIVDLDNCLELSHKYLEEVLDDTRFSKLRFISTGNMASIDKERFDLCINIDSFSEMPTGTVRYYLDYISFHCKNLYVKNPVCNSLIKSTGHNRRLVSGFLTRIYNTLIRILTADMPLPEAIDIFNDEKVKMHVDMFLKKYLPGAHWKGIADEWAPPWTNYWQVLYLKNENV